MVRTNLIFSPKYYDHNPGRNHPESANRLRSIINNLEKWKETGRVNWQFLDSKRASLGDVELVHGIEYVRLVEAVCKAGGGLLDLQDTVVSPASFDVALEAVGGALRAVDLVMEQSCRNAFALLRPPGHHASRYRACGFCIFNNVAIGTKHLLERYRLKRVAIVDIDAHHGNGTQEIFYSSDNVLYVSVHEDPSSFPGTGFADEHGDGEGKGFTVNIPLPFGTNDKTYTILIDEIVKPVILQFRPSFILISAGFDAYHSDPVGNLGLSASCYSKIFRILLDVAEHECNGRLVSVLEGGYDLRHLGKMAASAIGEMSEDFSHNTAEQDRFRSNNRLNEGLLRKMKKTQRAFWDLE